ncbi:MAG: aminotransferase class I/II-fold pyridoxal phosphate-dependent enzyme [Pseudomonadota bacterium]
MRKPNLVRRTPWPSSVSRPLVTPLQPSVVYASATPDQLDAQYEEGHGYTYSREGHPNAQLLAQKIDALEGGEGGMILSSGMAAITAAIFGLLSAGDHILGANQLYGRSLRLLSHDLPRFGITGTLADPTDAAAMAAAVTDKTRLLLVEVVSNPTLRVADMEGIVALGARHGLILVVDNTFTTPFGYSPFQAGADIVVHSVTKLLSGHSDTMLGYVAAREPAHRDAIRQISMTMGVTPSPFDCWLAERGLYTFDLRFERAQHNAARLAHALAEMPGVARVVYPGRSDHPDHGRALHLLQGQFGNTISFEIGGGRAAANALTAAMPDLAFAPTLGDVGTTLSHPSSSSHRTLTDHARAAIGISEGFFRVSVGIEDIDLLVAEFERGIAAAMGAR